MGIQNLLPFVKKSCRQGSISEFAGHSIAVDVSCLLHRGLFGCASDVAQGLDTDFYIRYVTKYVKVLVTLGCHVILVFDGKPLPAKKDTNDARREKRDFNKRKGEQLLSEGKASEAFDFFKRSVGITAEVVEKTIEALRSYKMVDILVAPYESDAQLAFLTKTGKAYAVVTEDSDLIAFGCERIILKLDHRDGSCTIYERENLSKCFQGSLAKTLDFTKFRRICILAGCDYLQNGLPGVGLNKAATFFGKASGSDMRQVLPRLPRYLNMNSLKIKKEFIEDFIRAENTFLYQIVFDPSERRQVPLYDYPKTAGNEEDCDEDEFVGVMMMDEKSTDYSYAGEIQASTIAMRSALGNRLGGPPIADKFILPEELPDWSIWSPNFKSGEERKRMKEEEENAEKGKCGAFTLTSFVRKVRKTETSYDGKDSVEIFEASTSKVEATVYNNSLELEADDDFVSLTNGRRSESIKAESLQKRTIKSFFSPTSKENKKEINSEKSNRMKKVGCVGSSSRGNGAQRNWSCEDLLKMYKMDRHASNPNASPESSQDTPVKTTTKRSACSINLNSPRDPEKRLKQELSNDAEITENCPDASENTLENDDVGTIITTTPTISCSSYFVNKTGIRASGLSRRVANPFKKVVIEEYASSPQKTHDEIEDVSKEKDPWRFHPTLGSSAYRASGLRRISATKENDTV